MSEVGNSRRDFIQKVAYTAPVIATVSVLPSIASAGSAKCNNGVGNGEDCLPPGLENKPELDNDDNGGVPGAPQNSNNPTLFSSTTASTKKQRKQAKKLNKKSKKTKKTKKTKKKNLG